MKKYAIIVAGGSGTRFGSTLPKQFVPLAGMPVLMHTINAFNAYSNDVEIVVALTVEHFSLWKDLCMAHSFAVPHRLVEGGATRFDSVKNALFSIADGECIVAVHDGARPLVSMQLISAAYDTAGRCGSAVPVVPLTDSVRQLSRNGSRNVDRDSLVAVQTPQAFQCGLLKDAYGASYSPAFTDDASAVEFRGGEISLIPGDPDNLKITRPMDLKIAEWILSQRNE